MRDERVQKKQQTERLSRQREDLSKSPVEAFGAAPDNFVQRMAANPREMSPNDVLSLQRTIGNQAVQRLVGRVQPRQSPPAPPAPPRLAGIRLSNGVIQRALQVGPANDRYEEEAEKISGSLQLAPLAKPTPKQGRDEDVSQIDTVPTISRLQRTAKVGPEGGSVDSNLESRIRQSQSSGSSMPSGIRNTLEPKLNANLSSVKVHTDSNSKQLNRDLGSKAFTHKNHIYYGAGQSPSNMNLTAHETVHTIQQGAVKQQVNRRYHDDNMVANQGIAKPSMTPIQRSGDGVIQRGMFDNWFGGKKESKPKESNENGGSWFKNLFKRNSTSKTETTKTPSKPQFDPVEDLQEQSQDNLSYERNLGQYAYRHPKAKSAVAGMLSATSNPLTSGLTKTSRLDQMMGYLFQLSGISLEDNETDVEEVSGSPLEVGAAGITHRIFRLWQSFGKPVPAEDLRLAILGWMPLIQEGGFHAVMQASTAYGLSHVPGQRGYMEIEPLTIIELRNEVATDDEFPHEHAFQRKVSGGGFKTFGQNNISAAAEAMDRVDWLGNRSGNLSFGGSNIAGKEVGGLQTTAASILYFYSSYGYLFMNPTQKGTGFKTKKQIERNIDKKEELKTFKKALDAGLFKVEEVIQEAQEFNTLMEESLAMMPDWEGDLWRGTASFNPWAYKKGSTVSFNTFTSATKDKYVAKDFADNYNIAPNKFLLRLKVKSAKDVAHFTKVSDEEEVMIQPGTSFRVVDRQKPYKIKKSKKPKPDSDESSMAGSVQSDQDGKGDNNYYIITLEEVGSSGRKLNVGKHDTGRRNSLGDLNLDLDRRFSNVSSISGSGMDLEFEPPQPQIEEEEDPYAIKQQKEEEAKESARVKLHLFEVGGDDPPGSDEEPIETLYTDDYLPRIETMGFDKEHDGIVYTIVTIDVYDYWAVKEEAQKFIQAMNGG